MQHIIHNPDSGHRTGPLLARQLPKFRAGALFAARRSPPSRCGDALEISGVPEGVAGVSAGD